MGVQSYEILKLKVTLDVDGRHSTWASALFPFVGENKNLAEDVGVCLKAGEDLIPVSQQGDTDLCLAGFVARRAKA